MPPPATRWQHMPTLKGSRLHFLQRGNEARRASDHDGWITSDDGGGELEEAQKVGPVQHLLKVRSSLGASRTPWTPLIKLLFNRMKP